METEATEAKQAGNACFQAGEFVEAKRHYSRGIECGDVLPPELLAQLLLNRSATHLKLEQVEDAKLDATRAAAMTPQWAKPHLRLAEICHAKREYVKAVDELEIALGLAAAAQDHTLVADINAKMDEYRLLKDAEVRGESQNLVYSSAYTTIAAYRETMQASAGLREDQDPEELLDKIVNMTLDGPPGLDRHVLLGHQALHGGRYQDAAREFLAAAVSGVAEGMYNYAVLVEAGRGVAKDVAEAVKWFERASRVPIQDDGPPNRNCGIGEAMSALARHHHLGIHFPKNDVKAVELWERGAAIGSVAALNALGVLHMNGSSRAVTQDIALARDYLRQAAEKFSNEAMLNLADLHASINEYDAAVRWADTAFRFGFLPAAQAAKKYRELAGISSAMATIDPAVKQCLDETGAIARMPPPTVFRDREAISLDDLRAIQTPYVRRLCTAKEDILAAMAYLEDDDVVMSAALAVRAHRIPDSTLILDQDEKIAGFLVAETLLDMGFPMDAGLALLLPLPDPTALVSYYGSLHRQFPEDITLATRAACAHMFESLPGSDKHQAVRIFDKAFALLPRPRDDSDPLTLDLLATAGPANLHVNNFAKAKTLLTRFVRAGARDGHRKTPEAHFHLGVIAMAGTTKTSKTRQKELLHVAMDHLRAGKALAKRLPTFLQPKEPLRTERTLANFVQMMSVALGLPVDLPRDQNDDLTHLRDLRGGEVLTGPARHEKLHRTSSRILREMKQLRVPFAEMMSRSGHVVKWTTVPPPKKQTATQRRSGLVPATVDELFSALRDHVYEGRSLECVIVAPPCSTGSSYSVLVEDSQREPAKIAVYNAAAHTIEQLVPGRVLQISQPYVRIATDQSILIRVDDPSSTLRVGDLHAICWNCSVVSDPSSSTNTLRSCAKCHRAKYCCRECQKEDWQKFGHRYLCG